MEEGTVAMAPDDRFAANMKALREAMGWNQADFARQLSAYGAPGLRQTTISRIEAGERNVRLNEAVAIAKVLRTTVEAMANTGPELQGVSKVLSLVTSLRDAEKRLGEAANEYNKHLVALRTALGDPEPWSPKVGHSPFKLPPFTGPEASGPLVVERRGYPGMDEKTAATISALSDHDASFIDLMIDRRASDIVSGLQKYTKLGA